MMLQAGIIKLPDLPMVRECSAEHLQQMAPCGTQTLYDVREQFLLDVATLKGRSLRQVAERLDRMRNTVRTHPAEFTSEAADFIERLHAHAVAQRLLGAIK